MKIITEAEARRLYNEVKQYPKLFEQFTEYEKQKVKEIHTMIIENKMNRIAQLIDANPEFPYPAQYLPDRITEYWMERNGFRQLQQLTDLFHSPVEREEPEADPEPERDQPTDQQLKQMAEEMYKRDPHKSYTVDQRHKYLMVLREKFDPVTALRITHRMIDKDKRMKGIKIEPKAGDGMQKKYKNRFHSQEK